MRNSMETYLRKIYYNPKNPGSFSGPIKLYNIVKKEGKYDISLQQIRKWLQNQDAYSLQRPVKRKFKRNKVIVGGLNDIWDIDLASVENLKKYNDNIRYLLIVIDVFSIFLYVEPLTDKKAVTVLNALKSIIAKGVVPRTIRSDKGGELNNRYVKQFLKSKNVYYFTTQNETKANYAERVIRTLRNMMFIYFNSKKTYRYMDILQDLVSNYNNSPHSSLGNITPAQVNAQNESRIWEKLYVDTVKPGKSYRQLFKFKVGSLVRTSQLPTVFEKDYQQKWTSEIFKVSSRRYRQAIPVYYLNNFHGEQIQGSFYESELQGVEKSADSLFEINKLIKQRRYRGQTQWYVSFAGWPASFNKWINEKDLKPAAVDAS